MTLAEAGNLVKLVARASKSATDDGKSFVFNVLVSGSLMKDQETAKYISNDILTWKNKLDALLHVWDRLLMLNISF